MTAPRHDRIFPLADLNAYPGSEWLDITFYLPRDESPTRRVWGMFPQGSPTVRIDDVELTPRQVHDGPLTRGNAPRLSPSHGDSGEAAPRVKGGPARWIDYGRADLQLHFSQLRIRGPDRGRCAESALLVTKRLDFSPAGLSLPQAERKLWGLARCDAGSTTLAPARVTVGDAADFRVRYTAGPRGLPAGGLVRFAVPKSFSAPQADAPDRPGFVRIGRADRSVAVDRIEQETESHVCTDIICRLAEPLAPGEGFELCYRTDRTHIFGHLFRRVDRRYWYSKLPPLSAAAAVSPDAPFVSPAEGNGHLFQIAPGPAERLFLFLPGRRSASEKLAVRGVFTDRFRNVPPAGPIDADIELWLIGGERKVSLGGPAGHFTARHRFQMPLPPLPPGVYRAVASRPGADEPVARSNPLEIMEPADGADRIFWGEIHGHSEMSDGLGDYAELYRHAREEGCLDFAAAADHACYHSDSQWQWMQDVTNAHDEPGRFVTLIGYEWAGRQVHRNIYTSRDRLALFRGMYPPTCNLNVVWDHFRGDEQVVGGGHAPMAHGIDFSMYDPDVERFIEIYSMWGASDVRGGPLAPIVGPLDAHRTVNELLATGARLGFTGGGDCHEGHVGFSCEDPAGQGTRPHVFAHHLPYRCGMTAAAMPKLARADLVAALRNRRTYATTGARILLAFSVSGVAMGGVGTIDASGRAECRAAVHAVEPIARLEIVKDGRVAWSSGPDGLDADAAWQDPDPPTHEHYYYLHVVQADGQMAWSSPVWLAPLTGR